MLVDPQLRIWPGEKKKKGEDKQNEYEMMKVRRRVYLHPTSLDAREVKNCVHKTQQTHGIPLHNGKTFAVSRGKRRECICERVLQGSHDE